MGSKQRRPHCRSSDHRRSHINPALSPQPCALRFAQEWGCVGDIGDIDVGLATPMEVYQSLAAEGYQMSHKRVPLSRERTPEAADLDVLYHQLLIQPEGKGLNP